MSAPVVKRRLIISPHLDDAVLSAWSAISVGNATVATVFAGVPSADCRLSEWDLHSGATDPVRHLLRRREEDVAAMRSLSAHCIHLDFIDHQYRIGATPHQALVVALQGLADGFDEVWFPAAIGGHPDHAAVAKAAMQISGRFRRFMYADLPYASKAWPLNRSTGFPEPTLELISQASPWAPAKLPGNRRLNDAECAAKRGAIRHYTSQGWALDKEFPVWWKDSRYFQQEWFWELEPRPSTASHQPFLTVLMRTQGTRSVSLKKALESLARQTLQDFELIILAHNVSGEARTRLDADLVSFDERLRRAASIINVEGGLRAKPLNVGMAAAKGRYFAVLDDDDHPLPRWVEEFARLNALCPGQILRAGVVGVHVNQPLPSQSYPDRYVHRDHLVRNRSPCCGLAFPTAEIRSLGLGYDESLRVGEDWDFLVHAAAQLGVASSATTTSLYQHWGHQSDSQNENPPEIWLDEFQKIYRKFDRLSETFIGPTRPHLSTEGANPPSHDSLQMAKQQRDLWVKTAHSLYTSSSWRITAPLRKIGATYLFQRNLWAIRLITTSLFISRRIPLERIRTFVKTMLPTSSRSSIGSAPPLRGHRTLFVHAGGAKAGSSALQNQLALNAAALSKRGLDYVTASPDREDQVTSGNAVEFVESLMDWSLPARDIATSMDGFFKQNTAAVCSSELFQRLTLEQWQRFLNIAKAHNVSIEAIFFVRDVLPFFQSGHDQFIKNNGETRDFDSALATIVEWIHAVTLKDLAHLTPRIKLHVLHYESVRSDVFGAFMRAIGRPDIKSGVRNVPVNRSLTQQERELILRVNKTLSRHHASEISILLMQTRPDVPTQRSKPSLATLETLSKRFSANVEWINQRFFEGKPVVSMLGREGAGAAHGATHEQKTNEAALIVLDWALSKLVRDGEHL